MPSRRRPSAASGRARREPRRDPRRSARASRSPPGWIAQRARSLSRRALDECDRPAPAWPARASSACETSRKGTERAMGAPGGGSRDPRRRARPPPPARPRWDRHARALPARRARPTSNSSRRSRRRSGPAAVSTASVRPPSLMKRTAMAPSGECPRLVGADHGRGAERLHGGQPLDEGAPRARRWTPSARASVSVGSRPSGTLATITPSANRRPSATETRAADHTEHEEDGAERDREAADEPGDAHHLPLERARRLGHRLGELGDDADLGRHAGRGHDEPPLPGHDRGAREHELVPLEARHMARSLPRAGSLKTGWDSPVSTLWSIRRPAADRSWPSAGTCSPSSGSRHRRAPAP